MFDEIGELVRLACDAGNVNDAVTILPRDALSPGEVASLEEAEARVVYVNFVAPEAGSYYATPFEGLIGVGKAYLNNDEDGFYRLYGLLREAGEEGRVVRVALWELKEKPELFITALRFVLRPIAVAGAEEVGRIKRRVQVLMEGV